MYRTIQRAMKAKGKIRIPTESVYNNGRNMKCMKKT